MGGALKRHFSKADLRLAGAADLLERNAAVRQMALGQFIQPMIMRAGVEGKAQQQRVIDRRDGNAMLREDVEVIFQGYARS
jgi:hypothetical protein